MKIKGTYRLEKGTNQKAIMPRELASENLLKEFTYYFVLFIENTLTKWKKYLDGNPDEIETSIPGSVLARMASELPFGGDNLSDGISYLDRWRQNRSESTKAKRMFNIIYFFDSDNENFRNILTEGAFDIFHAYHQFSLVSCKEGPLRAMQKLGMDASQRFLSYIFDNDVDSLTPSIVTKSIILGKSSKHPKNFLVRGKKLEIIGCEKEIRTKEFFESVGVCVGKTYVARYKDKNFICELGYREKFSWEDESDFKFLYVVDSCNYSPKHNIDVKEKEKYLKIVTEYIISKNPFEDMKGYMRNEFENLKSTCLDQTVENKEIFVNIVESLNNINKEFKEERDKSQENITKLIEETERAKKYCVLCNCGGLDHAHLHYCTPSYNYYAISVA